MNSSELDFPKSSKYQGEPLLASDCDALRRVYRFLNGFNDFTPDVEEAIKHSGRSLVSLSGRTLSQILAEYPGPIDYIDKKLLKHKSTKESVTFVAHPERFTIEGSAGKSSGEQFVMLNDCYALLPDFFGNPRPQITIGSIADYVELHCILSQQNLPIFGASGFGYFAVRARTDNALGVVGDFGNGLRVWAPGAGFTDERVRLAALTIPAHENLKTYRN